MKIDLQTLTIVKARESLRKGEYTVIELAQAYLDTITKKNKDINAYLEVYGDVMKQAEALQKEVMSDKKLVGIPFAIKDNIVIEGRRAGSASKILEGYVSPYDATAISKLKAEGALFLGRVNMDEFAMGGSTENSAYGVTKNPHDLTRVSGGSSGGSASAVAMDGALCALGSDTGGSVRQPASYCGVVGLKPTYGSISRHGLMAMGSSLDVIGPITKTVTDAEILFDCMRGVDVFDSTSIEVNGFRTKPLPKKMTIGIPRHFLSGDGIDASVKEVFEKAIADYKRLGYTIVDVELPNIEYSLSIYYILMPAEVSSNLARFDGVKYGAKREGATGIEDYFVTRGGLFGRETRRRIMLGTYVLSSGYYDAYYGKAQALRQLLSRDFVEAYTHVDIIMTPTAPTPAFKIGEKSSDPVAMYLADIFTVTANLVGIPALSVPYGVKKVDGKELPIGVQLMANHGREDVLFKAGRELLGE